MPQKDTLDRAAYTCMLVSYRCLSAQFEFSMFADTLGFYLNGRGYRPGGVGTVCCLCGAVSGATGSVPKLLIQAGLVCWTASLPHCLSPPPSSAFWLRGWMSQCRPRCWFHRLLPVPEGRTQPHQRSQYV